MAADKGKPAPADKPRSIAHHLEAAGTNQAHALRHIAAAEKSKSPSARRFNLDHAKHHAQEAQAKIEAATKSVAASSPGVAAELAALQAAKPQQVPPGMPMPPAPTR